MWHRARRPPEKQARTSTSTQSHTHIHTRTSERRRRGNATLPSSPPVVGIIVFVHLHKLWGELRHRPTPISPQHTHTQMRLSSGTKNFIWFNWYYYYALVEEWPITVGIFILLIIINYNFSSIFSLSISLVACKYSIVVPIQLVRFEIVTQ